ncbi:MAG: tetraacyldisaccharide 4'-kinase [Betaproteobacteria bacterium]
MIPVQGRPNPAQPTQAPAPEALLVRLERALGALWWRPPRLGGTLGIWILAPLSWAYRALAAAHRRLTRAPAAPPALLQRRATPPSAVEPAHAAVPTIVVGNWVVGGAGKTPATLALLAHLQGAGWTPGVVSRGYGRHSGQTLLVDPLSSRAEDVGDEPLLLARRAGVRVAVGRDRRRAREHLLQSCPEVNLVVADDGLQHHRLWRDLEVVVVDERGAGNGRCIPAGPLREPLPTTLPPRALLLYSAGVATLGLPGFLAQRHLAGIQTLQDWLAGQPCPADGGWEAVRDLQMHAAAAIAVPERFFESLRQRGITLAQTHPLPDHDPWHTLPWDASVREVIVTEKDAVKLTDLALHHGSTRIWVARLDLRLPTDFTQALDQRLHAFRPGRAFKA